MAHAQPETWQNSRYTVQVNRLSLDDGGESRPLINLQIKAHDFRARHDWRDFQRIKNELIGNEEEAIEIYPAESRLIDTCNMFHLWCAVGYSLRFGCLHRIVSESGCREGSQRPWEDDARPPDLKQISMKNVARLIIGMER